MSRQTIRWLVIVSTLSIIAVIITQIYWVRKSLLIRERQFDQQVFTSLYEVAQQLADINKVMLIKNPVEQLSSDQFVVNTNATIEPSVLEHYLVSSFQKHQLNTDFEVGIYDCATNRIMYGMAMSTRNHQKSPTPTANWLKSNKYTYYFEVRFANQANFAIGNLQGWIWSSALVLIALTCFAYALFVILRQKQLSEVQRDFMNNMTHEFQTPIATIKIATDVLKNPAIASQPDRFTKYIDIVQEETLRLQNQVESVLNMAKADRNELALKIEWIDLHQVVVGIADKYEKTIQLSLEAIEPYINADRIQLQNLISNLLDNAIKYSPNNPEIYVRSYRQNNQLILSVKDNGIGIAPEEQRSIFKKFYRVSTGNLHNVKGFGIGLSYVRQIVKAHKWKIEVDSALGKGSEFKVLMGRG